MRVLYTGRSGVARHAGQLFPLGAGKEYDLPRALAEGLVKAGQAEKVGRFARKASGPAETPSASVPENKADGPAEAPRASAPEATVDRPDEDKDGAPPLSGPGSGRPAWAAYAARVSDAPASAFESLSRDEIVAVLTAEGRLA